MRTDERLIAGFLAGDPEAVEIINGWIVRASAPYRHRLAPQWDDVLQEARLEVSRTLQRGQFRGESSLLTYLWRVINHVCLTRLRRQRRLPAMVGELPEIGDPRPSALDGLLEEENARLSEAVLAGMPGECVQLWRMILAGEGYRAISGKLGVAEGALRVRALRCRKKAIALREQMLEKRR
jgi:RNA polymerase sigma factor (sigma-70 family)